MGRSILPSSIAAAAMLVLATPALAAPPAGVYRCTRADSAPAGLLKLLADGKYQYEAVSDADFTPVPRDPANGSGTLAADGHALTPQSGPLKSYFKASGKVSAEMGITTLQFADSEGNPVLDCSP